MSDGALGVFRMDSNRSRSACSLAFASGSDDARGVKACPGSIPGTTASSIQRREGSAIGNVDGDDCGPSRRGMSCPVRGMPSACIDASCADGNRSPDCNCRSDSRLSASRWAAVLADNCASLDESASSCGRVELTGARTLVPACSRKVEPVLPRELLGTPDDFVKRIRAVVSGGAR